MQIAVYKSLNVCKEAYDKKLFIKVGQIRTALGQN